MKLVRRSHPAESNILMLSYFFLTASFFSYQMFGVTFHELLHWNYAYFGMFLIGLSVTLMVMIVWEELLFKIKAYKVKGGLIFRNPSNKLKIQTLLYAIIPVIFVFIYFQYDVNILQFSLWASICLIPPVAWKIRSGIKNYKDFLILTSKQIEYKNNEKEGCIRIEDLKHISVLEDQDHITKRIQLVFKNNDQVLIDLHEMELDDFYESIDRFISIKYRDIMKSTEIA